MSLHRWPKCDRVSGCEAGVDHSGPCLTEYGVGHKEGHAAGVAWAVKRLREMIDKAPVGSLSAVAWATAADTLEREAKEGRR